MCWVERSGLIIVRVNIATIQSSVLSMHFYQMNSILTKIGESLVAYIVMSTLALKVT